MSKVKTGDKVAIHYTGSLTDGSVFDSSEGRAPLEFTVGSGQIIPGLDAALPGMEVGDRKKITIAPADAYGEHNPQGVLDVPRSELPDDIPLKPGTRLEMRSPDGRAVPVAITAIGNETVTLDANHMLAGKELVFDFELVKIG